MKKGRGSLEKTESRDAWIMMTPALITGSYCSDDRGGLSDTSYILAESP